MHIAYILNTCLSSIIKLWQYRIRNNLMDVITEQIGGLSEKSANLEVTQPFSRRVRCEESVRMSHRPIPI